MVYTVYTAAPTLRQRPLPSSTPLNPQPGPIYFFFTAAAFFAAAVLAAAPAAPPLPLENTFLDRFQANTRSSTLPISCSGFRIYVNLARRARFGLLLTISMPATFLLYTLYHISTPTLARW